MRGGVLWTPPKHLSLFSQESLLISLGLLKGPNCVDYYCYFLLGKNWEISPSIDSKGPLAMRFIVRRQGLS